MSEEFILEAESRELIGKKVSRLRRDGIVPAVIYGLNDPEHIQLNALKTRLTLRDADDNALLKLKLNGKSRTVMARAVQRHATRGDLLHIDFYEVDMDSTLTTEVTLELIGESDLEIQGIGAVRLVLNSIEIEAKPSDLISVMEIDRALIKTPSDSLLVEQLNAPAGITILTSPDVVVATFATKRGGADEDEGLEEASEDSLEVSAAEDVE